ncbi:LCP family protein [Mycolicibacterium fortuitum]|uniref:LCP family protein n=1 Tax=Mycolicibacterium fortuitum TaxID=1766 RepID=A0AAE4V8U2_MYCFO|nr:LCP family protein [Mycolicibacterium fortuitum]MDV7190874.1 LCP family protein [Mycolicibacterium fortuitum]MDV7204080.1 LCP family protein [Mycolicibacterium fortuitum]MDV7227188.1 LCP family protein [Mycolicibacterium fortuitum]MDV7290387.1 LCP family protein [Mycolicibacterium fortuitum]MDV7298530.1 LCP family protein [Mycolicibacterium fortuitum]
MWPPNPPTPPRQPPRQPPQPPLRQPPRQSPPPPRPAPPPPPPPPRPRPTPRPAAARPAAPAPVRKPRRRRRWGRLVLAVLLVAVLAAIGGGFWIDSSLHRIPALADYPERPATAHGTTWLLVGSDSRQNLSPEQQAELATGGDIGTGRTDTILLVHIPGLGSGTPATMVSIPRDSYLPIPGYGEDKVNAAFSLGGAPLLAQTVEQATGLHLDHYAEIGFDGFAALVDAVGGVRMCPAEPISDPLAGIDLPAGCQEFDGRNALGYVRSRATPRADLDRMINQRAFMSALLHRATSPEVLLNPLRWQPMARAATNSVAVDEDAHVWDLGRLAWAMHGDDMVTTTVPIGEFTGSDSGAVVVWDSDAAGRLFTALANDTTVPDDVIEKPQP